MPTTGTKTVTANCTGDLFYDDQKSGNYAAGANGVLTLCPATAGTRLVLTFNSWSMYDANDYLVFYDGTSTSSPLLGTIKYSPTSPGTIQASDMNTSGCITIKFISATDSWTADGWKATITCRTPCAFPTASATVDGQLVPSPALKICQGDVVNFDGSGSTGATGKTISTWAWTFDDAGATGTGQTTTHKYNTPGVYQTILNVTDNSGCKNINSMINYVFVSSTPIFKGTNITPASPVCSGVPIALNGVITPVTKTKNVVFPPTGTVSMPDGTGVSYDSPVTISAFTPGQTLTNIADLISICITIEHSAIPDLSIVLKSPSGQTVSLLDRRSTHDATKVGQLGIPVVNSNDYVCNTSASPGTPYCSKYPSGNDGVPGTGWVYCFTPSAANGSLYTNATTGTQLPAGNYASDNPLSALIGSILNGTWTLSVTDNEGGDDGTLFAWSMTFASSLYPSNLTFTPTLTGTWTGSGITTPIANPATNVTPATTGSLPYMLTAKDDFGCVYDTVINVTINSCCTLPTANAGTNNTISCTQNQSGVQIGMTAATGVTYAWSPATGLSSASVSNPTATPTTTTTYTLTATNGSPTCTATSQVIITVSGSVPSANAGSNGTISCTQNTSGWLIGANTVAGNTYLWSPITGLSSASISNPLATPTTTTTYTLTATNTASGCSATNSVIVSVSGNVPSANAGSNGTINCTTNSVTIGSTSVVGNTYLWSPTTNLSSSSISNPTATPTITTTYTLTATNTASGCSASNTVIVYVDKALPTAVAGADGTVSCTQNTSGWAIGGASVANMSYLWNPISGLSSSTTSNPTANPTSTTSYTLTITSTVNNCTATDAVNVTVNKTPPTANAGSDGTITCTVASVSIGAANDPTLTYNWTPTLGLSSSSISNPTATPTVTTSYTLVVTNTGNSCTASDGVNITVDKAAPMANAGTDGTISCIQNTSGLTIGTTSTPNMTYIWNPTLGLTSSSISNPTANPASTTSYTLTTTSTINNCTATSSVNVTVNKNLPTANAGTGGTINCSVANVSIGAANDPTLSYNWTPALGLSSSTVSNPTATPNLSTSYTLVVTNTGNSCTASDGVNITVDKAIPVANAGSNGTISCAQNTSGWAIGTNPVANINYSWTPTTDLSSATISNPTATPTATTLYTLVATNPANNCSASNSVNVVVDKTVPVANAGSDATITCISNANGVTIGIGSVAGVNYNWLPILGLSNASISNPLANPNSTTKYTLTSTNIASGCTATSSVNVTNSKTTPVANAGNDVTICYAGSTLLTATGGTTYLWNPSTGLDNATISSPTATPVSTQKYTVTATETNGCSASASITVSVIPLIMASAGSDKTICDGASTTLSGTGGTTYLWSSNPAGFTSISQGPLVSPSTTTTYTVIATTGGCTGTSTAVVTVNPVPNTDFTISPPNGCVPLTVSFIDNTTPTPTSYVWNFGDGNTSYTSSPINTYNQAGTYTVSLNATISGCSKTKTKIDAIEVFQIPVIYFSWNPKVPDIVNSGATFSATSTVPLSNFLWTFGEPSSPTNTSIEEQPTHTFGAAGSYDIWLYAASAHNCKDSTSQILVVKDKTAVFIPNAFSPNGDGYNDNFGPSLYNIDLAEYSFQVFSRWGQLIFSTSDYNKRWNGTINDKGICPNDVYTWKLNYTDKAGKVEVYVGSVVLIK